MPSRIPLAPLLSGLIHLTRYEPDATEAQAAFLALIRGLIGKKPLRLVPERDVLLLNQERVSLELPGATLLSQQMLLHGIGVIELPARVSDEDLGRLVTLLAAFPGSYDGFLEVVAALGPSADRIRLTAATEEQEVYRLSDRTRISGASREAGEDELEIQRGDADTIRYEGDSAEGPGVFPEGAVVPVRPTLGSILTNGREAAASGNWDGLLDAALQLIEAEESAPSDRTGRTYRHELKRLITEEHLVQLARLSHGDRRQEVVAVLRRFDLTGTEVLVDLLVNSPNLGERRSYYTAITQMRAGAEAIFSRLDDPHWYVARNAAELCADMEIEDAVPALGRQIHHEEERVRRAVAGALARIGTPIALEWLRKTLRDPSEGVRRQALSHLGGGPSRQLVGSIVELLEQEHHPEVQREALLALGRSGSPDAIAALDKWAGSLSPHSGATPLPLRLLAIKGLSLAGPPAAQALTNLTRDGNAEVRAAASAALEGMRL
jgi:HEAT repeat protein